MGGTRWNKNKDGVDKCHKSKMAHVRRKHMLRQELSESVFQRIQLTSSTCSHSRVPQELEGCSFFQILGQ